MTRDREQDHGGEVRGSVTALAADWGLLTNCLEKQVVASVAGRRQLQLCPAPAPQPVSAYTAAAASLYTTARGKLGG